MRADYEGYIRERFAGAAVKDDPFPHIVIRDVLPPDLYAQMDAAQPSEAEWSRAVRRKSGWRISRHSMRRGLSLFRRDPAQIAISEERSDFPSLSEIWRREFAPYLDLIDSLMHAKFKRQDWRPGQRLFFYRPAGWAIVPHTHNETELTNSLLYFPAEDNITEQGTFLYRYTGQDRPQHENFSHSDVEVAAFVPYTRNTLVSWINSPASVHGSMETAHSAARRYLYFVSERLD
jgi:hypothetical protein